MNDDLIRWREYCTTNIQRTVDRPSSFGGREPEIIVVIHLETWLFAQGKDPQVAMKAYRKMCGEYGEKGCGPLGLRDHLKNPHRSSLTWEKNFYEIEWIVGSQLAMLAQSFDLDITIPTRRPEREPQAPKASATSETPPAP